MEKKESYKQSVQAEIEHYAAMYQNEESQRTLTEKVPPSWFFVSQKFNELIRNANEGRSFVDEIAFHMQMHPGGRTLSIGSGPGALEIEVAQKLKKSAVDYEIVCMDINPHVLDLGRERAKVEGLSMKFQVQDINELSLEPEQYDVIMCHASLHHLINLEHIYYEMNRALKPDGRLVVLDIVTRNGYLMWEETHAVVRNLWNVLPDRFKYNHTAYGEVRLDLDYENRDYTGDSMECIRSGDVLPLLDEYFARRVFVPFTSISRRFLDTMYGPNYDLLCELDQSLVEFIWQLDVHYIAQNILKPETIFAVYTKGNDRPRPPKYMETSSKIGDQNTLQRTTMGSSAVAAQFSTTEVMEILHILGIYRRIKGSRLYGIIKAVVKKIFI